MKLRHEYKHRINMADRLILRRRLSAIAGHDINSNADGTYRVKSLYFDNYMDKALKEKCDGLRLREKFRIRCYNDDASFIRLEKKSKIGNMCSKESVIITQEQCMKILNGDIGFLKESSNNLMCEFYAKIRYQLLRPKCIVAYTRESFVYEPGNVRITLDYDICRSSNTKAFLAKDNIFIQPNKDCILEVKYDEFLPQIIRNAVQTTNRRAAAYSKYAAMRF